MRPSAALRTRPLLVDLALAAVTFAVTIGLMAAGGLGEPTDTYRRLDALGVLLALGSSLPLLVRRRAPYAALAASATVTIATYGLDYSADVQIGPLIVLYGIGASADGPAEVRRGQLALLTLIAVGCVAAVVGMNGVNLPEIVGLVVLWGGAWLIGDVTRLRRDQIAELRERAQRAEREAERERRLAAAEERTRIARELHDSAGHAINVILVQAGAARLLRERDPQASEGALRTVEDVARRTIGEIDRLVHLLREGEEEAAGPRGGGPVGATVPASDGATGGFGSPAAGGPGSPVVGSSPSPVLAPRGIAGLEALVADHRGGGLAVELRTTGEVRDLPGDLDRALYRIVQEALTNAARHGSGAADVDVDFGAEAVSLRVANPVAAGGAPSNGAEPGWGIVGMRERAALLGGTLEAGRSGGGYRVHAVLPR